MDKFVVTTNTQGVRTAAIVPATFVDVINPTVPLVDASSNVARLVGYLILAKIFSL